MFKKDIELVYSLNSRYGFQPPLLDAGGLEKPVIADYEISVAKALSLVLTADNRQWEVKIPHPEQGDRYLAIARPWTFIDQDYQILNPEYGHPPDRGFLSTAGVRKSFLHDHHGLRLRARGQPLCRIGRPL